MKKHFIIAAVSAVLAVCSCGPVTYSSPENLNLKSVDEYAFIEPVSDILYYGSKNRAQYDYELSDEAAELVASIISSQRYPFSRMIRMDYDGADRDVRRWIQNLGDVPTTRLDRVRVPKALLEALDKSGHRYGVVIYSSGYIRSREAIRYEERQEALGDAISAVIDAIASSSKKNRDSDDKKKSSSSSRSSSTYNPDKNPYDCNLYCVVIDNERDEIVHYIHPLPFLENDPLNGRDMESMLTRLLRDFI